PAPLFPLLQRRATAHCAPRLAAVGGILRVAGAAARPRQSGLMMTMNPSTTIHSNPQLIGLPPRPPRRKKHDGGDRGLRPLTQIQKKPGSEPEQSTRLADPIIGPKDGVHLKLRPCTRE